MINQILKEAITEILTGANSPTTYDPHPLIGERVIIRTYAAGVHYGTLVATGDFVHLTDAHRIWKWEGAFTLSEVSQVGITGGRIACGVPTFSLPIGGVIEILNLTDQAHVTLSKHIES